MSDSTLSADITKSVDQLCAQLSVTNIAVPRIDTYNDVYDFISEYEMATATLSDEQKLKLLIKAFPPGRYANWFKINIKSYRETWSSVKDMIIARFSSTEDKDRQLRRLHELKFDTKGSSKLYDFVEDLLYSFNVAFPEVKDDEKKIRYIKSRLPSATHKLLITINQYNSSKLLKDFMDGIRQYDTIKSEQTATEEPGKLKSSEVYSMLKDLAETIKKQNEVTCSAVAALQRPRSPSPVAPPRNTNYQSNYQARGRSPQPYYPSNNNQQQHNYQSSYGQRSPSPARRHLDYTTNNRPSQSQGYYYKQNYDNNSNQHSKTNQQHSAPRSPSPMRPSTNQHPIKHEPNVCKDTSGYKQAFDSNYYYNKFGYPPYPCPNCSMMHWAKHCHHHLN